MLYAKYSRSMEMLSPLSTALVKPTTAGETAKNIRHEYEIGGDGTKHIHDQTHAECKFWKFMAQV